MFLNVLLVWGLVTVLWAVSVRLRNVSIIDPWWSIAMLLPTVATALRTGFTPPKILLVTLVSIWALRLWAYLLRRGWGAPEDARYAAFRQRYGPERYWWFSYGQVFLLQGVLALVVSAPMQLVAAGAPRPWSGFDVLGTVLFAFGFTFEAVGDAQLRAFKANPANRGRVMDRGLWSLTRHPNYFGEAVLGWGFGAFALAEPWGWPTLVGPILMTWLLLRVSGVALLDRHLAATRPGYAEYIARTPAFFPRWPR